MKGKSIAIVGRNGEMRPFSLRAGWPAPMIETVMRQAQGWLSRFHQRRALGLLDERMLRDIGVSRPEAEREAQKPFWQA